MNPDRAAPQTPRIIPVVDILNGQAVRAIGGLRESYRPVQGGLADSSDPLAVAESLLAAAQADELYVADLDAITGPAAPSPAVKTLLERLRCRIWVDIGIRQYADRLRVPDRSYVCPVVGFETARSWETLRATRDHSGRRPIALSIDLRDGELLGNWRGWELNGPRDVVGLAGRAIEMGVESLIVLDVARVGRGSGCGTEHHCQLLRSHFPTVDLIAGGGVRGWADVDQLGESGVDGVLVASALHDRALTIPRPGAPRSL